MRIGTAGWSIPRESAPSFPGQGQHLMRDAFRWVLLLRSAERCTPRISSCAGNWLSISSAVSHRAVTATFRMLCVFVVIEHGTRRLAHVNVTTHPSAAWTLQQLREVIADADDHEYLIHDRDSIFARHLDDSIRALSLAWLRSPLP
jgi:hypothetical protein